MNASERLLTEVVVTEALEEGDFSSFKDHLELRGYTFGFLNDEPMVLLQAVDKATKLEDLCLCLSFYRRYLVWPDGLSSKVTAEGAHALLSVWRGLTGTSLPQATAARVRRWARRTGFLRAAVGLVTLVVDRPYENLEQLVSNWMQTCDEMPRTAPHEMPRVDDLADQARKVAERRTLRFVQTLP